MNIGSNSSSSRTSAPIAGQPNAIESNPPTSDASNSAAVKRVHSAPFSFAPSATAFAIASVFPVALQYTTAVLLIKIPLSALIGAFYGMTALRGCL